MDMLTIIVLCIFTLGVAGILWELLMLERKSKRSRASYDIQQEVDEFLESIL